MSADHVVLAATTAAATSSAFGAKSDNQILVIKVNGLAGSEKAYLKTYEPISATYVDYSINGAQPYCDVGNNVIYVSGSERFKIAKDASVAAVGVSVTAFKDINL